MTTTKIFSATSQVQVGLNREKCGFDCIPEGTPFTVTWDGIIPTVLIPSMRPAPFKIGNKGVAKLLGKKIPTLATLERWDRDGVCKTVLGARTEPDGYGPHGEPSWLLTLGLI